MGKHKKWTLGEKAKIVNEFKKGVTISYLNSKYEITSTGLISTWSKKYDEEKL